ncbi:MAG: HNH endonuclease [Chloroflexi bacterium]|nr:HNH endonuclease [Chloroflexota bacterium]
MNLWKRNRRRRRSLRTWMVLAAIGASLVFSVFSPPDSAPGTSGGASRRPAATSPRATPRPIASATSRSAAPARAVAASGCFPHQRALVRGNMNIRQEPFAAARLLGSTPPGESYKVVASRQGDVYCWIDIDLGWIAVTEFVSGGGPRTSTRPAARTTATIAVDPGIQRALETLGALAVAPENRCSPYDSDDYPYPQSVEAEIVRRMGGRIYGPYTGTTFGSRRETDIEHIVAKSEAHDSGLCGASAARRKSFARDLLNLTLASPSVNRHQKSGKDFAEWRPALNACWFADQIIKVKSKYGLTIDSREKSALQRTLGSCQSVEMR